MNGHTTPETLAQIRRGELPRETAATVLRHLSACNRCARLTDADDRLVNGIHDAAVLPSSDHPDHAQLGAYRNHRLDAVELEIVETHLEDCSDCRARLRRVRGIRSARRPRSLAFAAFAAAIVAAVLLLGPLFVDRDEPAAPPVPPRRESRPQPPVTETRAPSPRYANARWQQLVEEAVAQRRLPLPSSPSLDMPPDALRSGTASAEIALHPAGIIVEDTRPEFRWPRTEGATYQVFVYAGEREVAQSDVSSEPRWKPRRDLPRGAMYVWQVEVRRGDAAEIIPAPPAPMARFRILGEREQADLAAARARHPDDELLHAILYAKYGLAPEAKHALARAAQRGDRDAIAILNKP
jgi:hypothetical protein